MLSFKKERQSVFKEINVNLISKNPHQPRTFFDEAEIKSLADSIKEYGILNPLTIREKSGGYELISGERRLRAAKLAGFAFVPCHIIGASEIKSAQIALVENIVRQDLDFFEEAAALKQLSSQFGMTQSEIAAKISKTQSAVANKIRLLKLSPMCIDIIKEYSMTERHARALLRIEDEVLQCSVAKYIGEKGLNVQACENHIDMVLRNVSKSRKKNSTKFFVKDLRLFVNAVKNHVATLSQNGIDALYEQSEDENYTVISVKIPR